MKSYVLTASLLVAGAALAQTVVVVGKTLTSFDLFTYSAVVAVSTVAGSLVAIKRFLDDDLARHQWARLLYDLLGSNFVGFLTFLACEANNVSQLYTMGWVGVSALGGVGGVNVVRNALKNIRGDVGRGG